MIEGAGKDWVGSYLDTGNPVFVVENPLTTVEVLGPYALCAHLRDSVVYECPDGAMVQWVPLGQGNVDFHEIVQRVHALKPDIYVYIKPITGRPPHLMPYLTSGFWKSYPDARAFEFGVGRFQMPPFSFLLRLSLGLLKVRAQLLRLF